MQPDLFFIKVVYCINVTSAKIWNECFDLQSLLFKLENDFRRLLLKQSYINLHAYTNLINLSNLPNFDSSA